MSKPEWGTKRTCQSCGAHFYDLRKDTIVCPKCGTTYDPEAVLKSRRGRVVEKETYYTIERPDGSLETVTLNRVSIDRSKRLFSALLGRPYRFEPAAS